MSGSRGGGDQRGDEGSGQGKTTKHHISQLQPCDNVCYTRENKWLDFTSPHASPGAARRRSCYPRRPRTSDKYERFWRKLHKTEHNFIPDSRRSGLNSIREGMI